jgi:hypothetical protein
MGKGQMLSAAHSESRVKEYADALASFYQQYRWDFVVTLTFDGGKYSPSSETAARRFTQWRRLVRETARCRVRWLAVTDFGRFGDRVHLHALVRVRHTTAGELRRLWTHGSSVVEPYDPTKRFAGYLAWKIARGADYHFSSLTRATRGT